MLVRFVFVVVVIMVTAAGDIIRQSFSVFRGCLFGFNTVIKKLHKVYCVIFVFRLRKCLIRPGIRLAAHIYQHVAFSYLYDIFRARLIAVQVSACICYQRQLYPVGSVGYVFQPVIFGKHRTHYRKTVIFRAVIKIFAVILKSASGKKQACRNCYKQCFAYFLYNTAFFVCYAHISYHFPFPVKFYH